MSIHFIIVSNTKDIEKKYQVKASRSRLPTELPCVLTEGDKFWTISSKSTGFLGCMTLGFNKEYSLKRQNQLTFYIESPTDYFINHHLLTHIHVKRCIVIVDAFLVSTPENLTYLIHFQNKERAFAIAGMYDNWMDMDSGIAETGFGIITVPSNPLLKSIGVMEMPMIISKENVSIWLNPETKDQDINKLIHPYNEALMNGYPVSGKILSGQITNEHLCPIGNRLKPILI